MKRFLTFILVVALLLAQFAFAETDLVSSNSLFIPDKMIESLNNLFELGLKTNLAALGDVNDEISNLISELAEIMHVEYVNTDGELIYFSNEDESFWISFKAASRTEPATEITAHIPGTKETNFLTLIPFMYTVGYMDESEEDHKPGTALSMSLWGRVAKDGDTCSGEHCSVEIIEDYDELMVVLTPR